jgi:CBS domain-containing protein
MIGNVIPIKNFAEYRGYAMDNTEIFLDKYKILENIAINELKLPPDGSAVSKLEKRSEFKDIRYELNYCREVRNLLQHNQKLDEEFAVQPGEKMIELLDMVIERIKNPVRCCDVAIPFNDLVWRSMDDMVMPTIKLMNDRNISHVPILKDRRVVGDFSANCVFPFLLGAEDCHIDSSTRFRDLNKYLVLDAHPSETFKFIPYDEKLSYAEKLYEENYDNHDRIGLIFLTQNGKPDERLLGILTSWLILGK